MDRTQPVKFFKGLEIEKTKFFLLPTLISPNQYSYDECRRVIDQEGINHILISYMGDLLGNPFTMEVEPAFVLVNRLLSEGIKVTLEIRPDQLTEEFVALCPDPESPQGKLFVILLGVPFPNMTKIGSYTTVKLCGHYGDSNGGVWCMGAEKFASKSQFTPWQAYDLDEHVE